MRTVLQLLDQSCTAARTLQTEPSKPKADSPSEILRLTNELARCVAEDSARADQLAKKTAALVELVASLTASLKTCIDAGPVAADATNTLSLPEAGAFLRHDGLVQCHRTASRMQSRSLPTYLSCIHGTRRRSRDPTVPHVCTYRLVCVRKAANPHLGVALHVRCRAAVPGQPTRSVRRCRADTIHWPLLRCRLGSGALGRRGSVGCALGRMHCRLPHRFSADVR